MFGKIYLLFSPSLLPSLPCMDRSKVRVNKNSGFCFSVLFVLVEIITI